MEHRNKTLKRPTSAESKAIEEDTKVEVVKPDISLGPDPSQRAKLSERYASPQTGSGERDPFRNLLDESAREAFRRQWHRLERGLRLNRLRMYMEEMSAQCSFTSEEKERFFAFLQNALDRKLLNTHKIVEYLPELQKIKSIKGLEVRRTPNGEAKWGFVRVKKVDGTRRKKTTDSKVDETNPQ